GDDGNAEPALPSADDLALTRRPEEHERWRALGMDEVDADLRELRDLLLHGVDDPREFLPRATTDVEVERDDADAFREQPDELLERAGAVRRLHEADRAMLAAEGARGDDLKARCAEVRRELLRELLRVGRADRDPPRADRLERFDLAPDERDDGRACLALRPREEVSLEAVALERHRRRAAEHDHVAFLVREIRRGGLVAREDPLEPLGV